jgi:hypothetical protein
MSDNDNPQIRFGTFQVEAKARAIRLVVWVVAMSLPLYIAYELAPFLDREATTARVLSGAPYKDAEKQARASISAGEKKISYFEYPVSELASVSVEFGAVGEEKGPVVAPLKTQINLRTDRAILWAGTFTVLLAVLTTLVPSLTRLRLGSLHIQLPENFGQAETAEAQEPAAPATPAKLTPVEFFASEVQGAARRADGFFARSTLLLAGGIVMAFIGVGIFYVTLPETLRDETLMSYWPKVVRPTGVLIFVEAIAWFLLRQYRALVEDYKWFYRLYLKRANYLAALRILGTGAVRPEDVFVAASLIQEDLSGRLKSGETTESLEALRLPEESPVTEILRLLTTAKDRVKAEKPQSVSEKSGT